MKIRKIEELEKILLEEYGGIISSINEVNSFVHYSILGDQEHDYSLLKQVYKFIYEENLANPYKEIFILVFSKNGGIYDVKGIGEAPACMESLWDNVEWEEDF